MTRLLLILCVVGEAMDDAMLPLVAALVFCALCLLLISGPVLVMMVLGWIVEFVVYPMLNLLRRLLGLPPLLCAMCVCLCGCGNPVERKYAITYQTFSSNGTWFIGSCVMRSGNKLFNESDLAFARNFGLTNNISLPAWQSCHILNVVKIAP